MAVSVEQRDGLLSRGHLFDGVLGIEMQARLLRLFAKFRELRSAKAVMRHFREANLLLPVRPLAVPRRMMSSGGRQANSRILQVLKNPANAPGLGKRVGISRHQDWSTASDE
jgi:hypothetical protein